MLQWFYNNFKRSSKFPFTRLDNSIGGGNLFSSGGDITHDDYNFTKFVDRLRTVFAEILLKPIILQILMEFPELEKNYDLYNDINIIYYGHSEIEKSKRVSNLQALSTIASDLYNNLKRIDENGEEKPLLHPKYILKHIMEFTDEQMAENDKYWQTDALTGNATLGTGSSGSDAQPSGDTGISENPESTETAVQSPAQNTQPEAQV